MKQMLKPPIGERVTIIVGEGYTEKAVVHSLSKLGWLIFESDGVYWGRDIDKPADCEEWNPEKSKFLQKKSAVFSPELILKKDDGNLVESCYCEWETDSDAKKIFDKEKRKYIEYLKGLTKKIKKSEVKNG
jgi:hypothetical protein